MYNYDDLSDVEFEYLAQDIMQKKLKKELRRFARGKDGGIDLTDDTIKRRIVVQVKHYKKSTSCQLIRSLKKELVKIQGIKPEKYYIVTSAELSPDKVKEIRMLFCDFMKSDRNVLTLLEIDNFLQNKRNEDVVRKHFKLWFHSANLLKLFQSGDITCDSATLLSNIKANEKCLVQTKAFFDGLKILENSRVLLLTGAPGVGKTTTAQMLVLYFARRGYDIRYSSAVSDIGSLKRSLSDDPNKEEVILLDDCFGQLYYDMKSSQENELLLLIKFVKIMPKKILVLNSRIAILQQVRLIDYEWEKSLSNEEFKVHEINMDTISLVEKAKILYSHMYFSNIPKAYFHEIVKDEFYFKIVEHKNYTPRIIERVTLKNVYTNVAPNDYQNLILSTLNKPSLIWENEYSYRLQQVDRIFLSTLYSITDTLIGAEMLKACFNYRLKKQTTVDLTEDQFNNCLGRLNTSMIKIVYWKDIPRVGMINPSVNDFILERLNNSTLEKSEVLDSIISVHQARKMLGNEVGQYLKERLLDHRILDYIFENDRQKDDWIIKNICQYGICDVTYRMQVTRYLENIRHVNHIFGFRESRYEIVEALLSEPMCEFYRVDVLVKKPQTMEMLLRELEMSELVSMVNLLVDFFEAFKTEGDLWDSFTNIVVRTMEESIHSYGLHVDAAEEASGIDIEGILTSCRHTDLFRGEHYTDIDEAAEALGQEIESALNRRITNELEELPDDIKAIINNNVSLEFYSFELKDIIESYMYKDDSEGDEVELNKEQGEKEEIRYLFNR